MTVEPRYGSGIYRTRKDGSLGKLIDVELEDSREDAERLVAKMNEKVEGYTRTRWAVVTILPADQSAPQPSAPNPYEHDPQCRLEWMSSVYGLVRCGLLRGHGKIHRPLGTEGVFIAVGYEAQASGAPVYARWLGGAP